MPRPIWPYTFSKTTQSKPVKTLADNTDKIPTRTCFREFARNNDLINTKMPFAERNKLIDTMMLTWRDTCVATYHPHNRKQSSINIECGQLITIVPNSPFKPIVKFARFDLTTHCWLCTDCFYKKYPKPTSTGWTSKLPKPKIQSAKEIYETTGKRYEYVNKRRLRKIFDKSKANYDLIKSIKGAANNKLSGWIEYRCPHCPDFYRCLRAYQGYPPHECPVTVGKLV